MDGSCPDTIGREISPPGLGWKGERKGKTPVKINLCVLMFLRGSHRRGRRVVAYNSPFAGRWHQRRIREISGIFPVPGRPLPFCTAITQHRAGSMCCPVTLWAGVGRAAAGGPGNGLRVAD